MYDTILEFNVLIHKSSPFLLYLLDLVNYTSMEFTTFQHLSHLNSLDFMIIVELGL